MKQMIQARKEELQKRGVKGFTLMEMLIVVAIIAVLVAIAIPIFSAQLDKARAETDAANIRSGYAVVAATVLTDNITADSEYQLKTDGTVTGDTNYTCQGKSADLTANQTIAGQTVSWAKGDSIYYHFTATDNKIAINNTK
jgi:type IV pilus assembly protein PilA